MNVSMVSGWCLVAASLAAGCSKTSSSSPSPSTSSDGAATNTSLPSCSPTPPTTTPAATTPAATTPAATTTATCPATTATALFLDGTTTSSGTPVTLGTPITSSTPTTSTSSCSTTPTGPTTATFNVGPGLEGCEAHGLSWVPTQAGTAACGDPLVSWCCSVQQALAEFPTSAPGMQTAFAGYQAQGESLYNCAFAGGKYSFYFFGSNSTGYHLGSVVLSNVPATAPTAASCPLATSASIGLSTTTATGTSTTATTTSSGT